LNDFVCGLPRTGIGECSQGAGRQAEGTPLILDAVQADRPVALFGDHSTPDACHLSQMHFSTVENLLNGGRSNLFNVEPLLDIRLKRFLAIAASLE
jgi:hypothetical protein